MGFDLRTHIRDPKSGEIITVQPYQLQVSKEHGRIFVRNGKRYLEDGTALDKEETVTESKTPAKATDAKVTETRKA